MTGTAADFCIGPAYPPQAIVKIHPDLFVFL